MSEVYDVDLRYGELDRVCQIARGHADEELGPLLARYPSEKEPINLGDIGQVDANLLMRKANETCDRWVKTYKGQRWPAIIAALERRVTLSPKTRAVPPFLVYEMPWGKPLPSSAAELHKYRMARQKEISIFLVRGKSESVEAYTLRVHSLLALPPELELLMARAGALASVEWPLTQATLALKAYQADHDGYPNTLQALVPKYLASVPEDAFVAEPLHYRLTAEGFVVYSVGPNGKDDGGEKDLQRGKDDVVVNGWVPSAW